MCLRVIMIKSTTINSVLLLLLLLLLLTFLYHLSVEILKSYIWLMKKINVRMKGLWVNISIDIQLIKIWHW